MLEGNTVRVPPGFVVWPIISTGGVKCSYLLQQRSDECLCKLRQYLSSQTVLCLISDIFDHLDPCLDLDILGRLKEPSPNVYIKHPIG